LHYYTLTDIFLLGSMVLFVVRTFLPAKYYGTMGQSAAMQRYNLTGRVKNKPFMIIFAATENQAHKQNFSQLIIHK